MPKPSILMLIANFYPVLGGAEQQALSLSKNLVSRGINTSVLTRSRPDERSFEQIENVPVYRKIHVLDRGKWFGITYILSSFCFLLKMRNTYDIIHCHIADGLGTTAAIAIKLLFKKKVVIMIASSGQGSDLQELKKSFLNRCCLKLTHMADKIISLCSLSTEELYNESYLESQIAQLPNGIDINSFHPKESTKTENRIITVGHLTKIKGTDILLQAVANLTKKEVSHFHVDIIGDGHDRTCFENIATDLNIFDHISFHGDCNNVVELLQRSRIFVLPSRAEGHSNALLEAMACGLPVIATKVGGNLDVVNNNENGILVEKENPEQLANAIHKVLNDNKFAEQLGKNARETVVSKYTMERTVLKYVELYNSLFTDKSY
jgi:glycosyltransferase involved in cell wall biosynthesis